jgi:hypothetical protein
MNDCASDPDEVAVAGVEEWPVGLPLSLGTGTTSWVCWSQEVNFGPRPV